MGPKHLRLAAVRAVLHDQDSVRVPSVVLHACEDEDAMLITSDWQRNKTFVCVVARFKTSASWSHIRKEGSKPMLNNALSSD